MNAQSGPGGGAVARANPAGGALAEVLDRVLDKGIVIDAWASVSLLGIEIVGVKAQVVVASVETYLKYATAVSALNMPQEQKPAAKQMPSEAKPAAQLPSAEDVMSYLSEHTGGLRLEQMAEHFHAPKKLLEEKVGQLVNERKVRRDQARSLVLPAASSKE